PVQPGRHLRLQRHNSRIEHLSGIGGLLNEWSIPAGDTRDSGHLALDRYGRLFVTSPTTGQVLVFSAQGHLLATWSLTSQPDAPTGIFVDSQDNLYFTYPKSGTVRKYRPTK